MKFFWVIRYREGNSLPMVSRVWLEARIFRLMSRWWRTFAYTYGVLVPQACVTTLPSRSHTCATGVCHNLAKPSVTSVPSRLSQLCQAVGTTMALAWHDKG